MVISAVLAGVLCELVLVPPLVAGEVGAADVWPAGIVLDDVAADIVAGADDELAALLSAELPHAARLMTTVAVSTGAAKILRIAGLLSVVVPGTYYVRYSTRTGTSDGAEPDP